jgi:hypothetical protein
VFQRCPLRGNRIDSTSVEIERKRRHGGRGLRISVVLSNIGHCFLSERSIVLWSSLLTGTLVSALDILRAFTYDLLGVAFKSGRLDPNSNPRESMVDVPRESLPSEQ